MPLAMLTPLQCITGIDDGGALGTGELYILGDIFLKNVVAVYDVGAAEMRFGKSFCSKSQVQC
jgi:dihydroxyacetone kinase DhaKLM complex PTS-EIIA-like component DhaM